MQALDKMPVLMSVAGGLTSHFLFNKHEPRGRLPILSLLLGPPTALALFFFLSSSPSPTPSTTPRSAPPLQASPALSLSLPFLLLLLRSYAIHLGTLTTSVIAYRLSPLHPLASFPGPVICRVTRLWALHVVLTGNQHRYYSALHARYGTHVRTGPNHVHVSDASALPAVMGIRHFRRGERYGVPTIKGSTGSLLAVMDPQEHAQRRKIWDRSMNTNALLGYKDMLSARIGQLVQQLEKRQGMEVDLSSWLSCLSFDFMGDLAFGGAFRLLEQGSDVGGYMTLTKLTMRFHEVVGVIPWIKPWISYFPGVDGMNRFRKLSTESVLARKSRGSSMKDIFYYLLDEEGVGSGPPSLPTLILESGLAIIAGSDTTGTALSNLFFYLLSNPDILARLQKEVDSVFPPGADVFSSNNAVADMKLLNAVINETLRLQPAVPTGVQRVLPLGSGGLTVAGRWIPEFTTVQISAYSVHRDPQYFYPDPENFRPDRWLETKSEEAKLDQSAYFPFSYGPTNCVGKGLALLELRMVVCSLIQKFDLQLARGFRDGEWEDHLADYFILVKGKLPVTVGVRG